MRIFISSVSDDLEGHRVAACDVAQELDLEVVPAATSLQGPQASRGERLREIREADAVLAILAWRLVPAFGLESVSDDPSASIQWQLARGIESGKPLCVLMADESWPESLREDNAEERAVVRDLRGELHRLAAFFEDESRGLGSEAALPGFRAQVRRTWIDLQRDSTAADRSGHLELPLRRWPVPELPERPYPLLLHYSHPDLLAGRGRDLEELEVLLRQPLPLLGLHAPSGAGKSSLLQAGLVAGLRRQGCPVAFDRHPQEAGLADRLIGDLVDVASASENAWRVGDDHRRFAEILGRIAPCTESPPLLILDQFEDLLRHGELTEPQRRERRRARAVVATLLAATVQRQPGFDGPLCRWLLSYRREFHGEVVTWLRDVLRDAWSEELAGTETLPHDLSRSDRFQSWSMPLLGAPRPGSERVEEATATFLAAIETPMSLRRTDGTRVYPWRFEGDGAQRLARAFGEARVRRPESPLAPELQVVLAYLLARSGEGGAGETVPILIPEDPRPLIDSALEDHLRRAIERAFPANRSGSSRTGRSRALLALRELADAAGRRRQGFPADSLARAIGRDGREILEKMATPMTRLIVAEKQPEGWTYVLSHDRLAEVVVRVVEHEDQGPRPELVEAFHRQLAVDEELLALRGFVTLKSELYRSGESRQATRVPRRRFRRIAENSDALLWGKDRQGWWQACCQRRAADRRSALAAALAVAMLLVLVAFQAGSLATRNARRQVLFEQIQWGKPGAALLAVDRLAADSITDSGELLEQIKRRSNPIDLFERGVGLLPVTEGRSALVLRAVELVLPLIEAAPEDRALVATVAWALDYFPGRDPAYAEAAASLRRRVLEPLRRLRPPPPDPAPEDPLWAEVGAGSFWMGTGPEDAWYLDDHRNERPRHRVTLSSFRMQAREVTNGEYRRMVPDHPGADNFPAVMVTRYDAYAYAAWRGGRLPTEAEWEYAARAGCPYEYCRRDGRRATLDEVEWTRRNTTDPTTLMPAPRPAGSLEPNPWGISDMHGSVSEWVADWFGEYSAEQVADPWGPAIGDGRAGRGGNFFLGSRWAHAAHRLKGWHPSQKFQLNGFRVRLPSGRSG